MSTRILAQAQRKSPFAFWLGVAAVTAGVAMHVPMFVMASHMGYALAGMAMDPMMIAGMSLIVAGCVASAYGLIPSCHRDSVGALPNDLVANDANPGGLTRAHTLLMLSLVFAVIIDTMKPASLGFVLPGMVREYGLSREAVAFLPLFGLLGMALGSLAWGFIADYFGRRAAILLAAIMFIGTSICGAMPSFLGNMVMCFLMGAASGGMVPITYTLLAELVPSQHRGWFLVLLGGVGLTGGYLAAAASAAFLEPHFGWRIMWFIGLPTGFMLISLNAFIPESPQFLLLHGQREAAIATLRRFKARVTPQQWSRAGAIDQSAIATSVLFRPPLAGFSASINLAALAWSLVNFGLLLWLPISLRERGMEVGASDALLAQSSIVALPAAVLTAWFYARWSAKWTLVVFSALTAAGLLSVALAESGLPVFENKAVLLIAVLMVGANGLIAVLLPYSAETYPVAVRGRGTGFVAGSSRLGGLAGQAIVAAGFVPGLAIAALGLMVPVAFSAALVAYYGHETREQNLD